jgi:hypothetical protein
MHASSPIVAGCYVICACVRVRACVRAAVLQGFGAVVAAGSAGFALARPVDAGGAAAAAGASAGAVSAVAAGAPLSAASGGAGAVQPHHITAGLRFLRDASEVVWSHCDARALLAGVVALAATRCVGDGVRGVGLAQHWHVGTPAQRAMHRSVRDHLGTVSHFPAHIQRACVAALGNPGSTAVVRPCLSRCSSCWRAAPCCARPARPALS